MLRYLLLLIPNIIMWIVGLILAPVLPLFCDKNGKLPAFLEWFETWDAPHLVFDGTGETQKDFASEKWPFLEKISNQDLKLYLQRVFWLCRNTSYGFAYYFSGYDYKKADIKWVKIFDNGEEDESIGYDINANPWFDGGFRWAGFKCYPFMSYGVSWYFGWKFSIDEEKGRAMYAMRLSPFRKK